EDGQDGTRKRFGIESAGSNDESWIHRGKGSGHIARLLVEAFLCSKCDENAHQSRKNGLRKQHVGPCCIVGQMDRATQDQGKRQITGKYRSGNSEVFHSGQGGTYCMHGICIRRTAQHCHHVSKQPWWRSTKLQQSPRILNVFECITCRKIVLMRQP